MARSRRRALPAPPLVLQPVFVRVHSSSPEAPDLRKLGAFLKGRGLLTDGGEMKLEQGLEGQSGMLSLTLQDVRAWAHGLVLELTESGLAEQARWPQMADSYFASFDKGKPRKPTRLQRLIQSWSADQTWRGLLEACHRQSGLWSDLERALEYQGGLPEEPLLQLALDCHRQGDWSPWRQSYGEGWTDLPVQTQTRSLELLALILEPCHQERAGFLATLAQRGHASPSLVRAALAGGTQLSAEQKQRFRDSLLACLESAKSPPEARDLVLFKALGWSPELLPRLQALSHRNPRLAQVTYGPRPGRNWLEEFLNELRSE